MTAGLFERLDAELWFVSRLRDHGIAVFEGVTDSATRRERIREAILANGLSCLIIGRRNGKSESYQQCFERLFGERL
jgi:hypothetical protein